ncbi:MAG: LysR family transcriptional regulator [Pseudomonadota bacterium]|nr:MAG: LysR family transcriptional regulator [Pseudomonadota bacterium]
MDIANLETFIAVAELGSFSLASERLYLTQPAISKRIAALEAELDTRLFDRIGRRVDLTEAGSALLPRVRSILQAVEDTRCAIANLAGKISGRLGVGTSHHIGLHRLPPILRAYSRQYPDVELNLNFMDSEAACRAVEHGELELGIVTLPLTASEALRARPVWPDPLDIVVGKTHPLSGRKRITPHALGEHAAILPARGTYTREIFERTFTPLGVSLRVSMTTNYLETIKMMVVVGLGWSVLPRTMLSPDLEVLRVPTIKLERTLGVVWHAGRTLSNSAVAMLDALTSGT